MKIKENYAAIERTVALVKEKFGADSKIAAYFSFIFILVSLLVLSFSHESPAL